MGKKENLIKREGTGGGGEEGREKAGEKRERGRKKEGEKGRKKRERERGNNLYRIWGEHFGRR